MNLKQEISIKMFHRDSFRDSLESPSVQSLKNESSFRKIKKAEKQQIKWINNSK